MARVSHKPAPRAEKVNRDSDRGQGQEPGFAGEAREMRHKV